MNSVRFLSRLPLVLELFYIGFNTNTCHICHVCWQTMTFLHGYLYGKAPSHQDKAQSHAHTQAIRMHTPLCSTQTHSHTNLTDHIFKFHSKFPYYGNYIRMRVNWCQWSEGCSSSDNNQIRLTFVCVDNVLYTFVCIWHLLLLMSPLRSRLTAWHPCRVIPSLCVHRQHAHPHIKLTQFPYLCLHRIDTGINKKGRTEVIRN